MIPYNYAEEEVFAYIKSCCSENEPIRFMPLDIPLGGREGAVIPDIYLPNGCRMLDISPKTLIEVKANLKNDTFSRMREMYDVLHGNDKDQDYQLILITMEKGDDKYPVYKDLVSRNIQILCYGDLLEKRKANIDEIPIYTADILRSAQKAFLEGPNTFFLGAGVSMDEGLPSWKELLGSLIFETSGRIVDEKELDTLLEANDHSSIIMGRYIRRLFYDNDEAMGEAVHKILYNGRVPGLIRSKTIQTICELVKRNRDKVRSIITYNYDDLIEQQLANIDVSTASICDTHDPTNRFPVYHVHGIIDYSKTYIPKIVLSEDSYHEQYRRSFMWSNVEQLHALQNHNCFFIGLSMTDPNLRRLLDFARNEANSKNQRDIHCFAFLRKSDVVKNVAFDTKRFLEEQGNMLTDLGVKVIWYDEHNEMPRLLEKLHRP